MPLTAIVPATAPWPRTRLAVPSEAKSGTQPVAQVCVAGVFASLARGRSVAADRMSIRQ